MTDSSTLSPRPCKTAILISGSGSNLQAFIDQVDAGTLDLELALVISNKPQAYGLKRAQQAGIGTACIEHQAYTEREQFDRAIAARLDRVEPELIVLAGFMRILSPWFVRRYAGRILNIHPALLPKYPGLHTHQRALDAGDSHHGSTVHFVTEELDGGPCIVAGRIAIGTSRTAEELQQRVQAVEHRIYPQAAQWFSEGRVRYQEGHACFDGKALQQPVSIDFD